jgi:ketosteroid isomerase-like protein
MKRTIATLLLALGIFSCQQQPGTQANKETLKTLLNSYYDALSKKDLAKLNALTTSDFIMYDEGRIYTNAAAIQSIEELPPFTARFTFDSLNMYMYKQNASAYYKKRVTFSFEDSTLAPIEFLESATFRKESNEWKLRFLHSTMRQD